MIPNDVLRPAVPSRIWTIGHSTRTFEAFASLLTEHSIEILTDVRKIPASRRHPQFSQRALAMALDEQGIRYEHLPELGGHRRPRSDSPNTAWRNDSFRGYADYMATPEFRAGLERLLALAAARPTAFMCAEAVWWRCHRGLIADALKAAGHDVVHIIGPHKTEPHPFTPAARIVDGRLSYVALPLDLR